MVHTLSAGFLNHFEEPLGFNVLESAPNECVPFHSITESSNAGNQNCWTLAIQKGPSKLREQGGTQFDKYRQKENLGMYVNLILIFLPNTTASAGRSDFGVAYAEPWPESFDIPSIDLSDSCAQQANGLNNIVIMQKPWSYFPFIPRKKLIETVSMYSLDVHTQFKSLHFYTLGYIDYEN